MPKELPLLPPEHRCIVDAVLADLRQALKASEVWCYYGADHKRELLSTNRIIAGALKKLQELE